MFPLTKLFVVFFIALFWNYEGNAQYQPDAILLGDVKALTLKKGQYTSYRRGSAIPQLQCVGGSAGCSDTPDVVQCTNVGFDGTDYQWECKADLDKKYRFGSIVVSCEGYNHPEDPYILRGSCGLEYALDRTGAFYDNNHHHHHQHHHDQKPYYKDTKPDSSSSSVIAIIFLIAIIAGIYWFATSQQAPATGHPPPPPPSGFTGQSQPPPYGFNNQAPPPYGSNNQAPPPYGFKNDYSGQSRQSNQGGWGGFWSGAGVGGLAGYMFGSRNNNPHRSSYHHAPSSGSSFWGGSTNYGPSSSGGTGSGSGSGSSSETRTASGFGGTKRR